MTLLDEAQRQRALLGAILRRGDDVALASALSGTEARIARGLMAYRASAQVSAERALATAFGTVQQMLGDDSFAALARAYLHRHPPVRGDWAWFGEQLPAFLADSEALADEEYLVDVARLDWAMHRAALAADAAPLQGLERLADTDPARLACRFVPGAAVVESAHPIVAIWQAHQIDGTDAASREEAFAHVRSLREAGHREAAWVWRQGWRVRVCALPQSQLPFQRQLLSGQPLAQALDACGDVSFEAWLTTALREGWLTGFDVLSETS